MISKLIDRIVCFLRTDWFTKWPIPISGHQMFAVYESLQLHLLVCDYCGHMQPLVFFDIQTRIEMIKAFARKRKELEDEANDSN